MELQEKAKKLVGNNIYHNLCLTTEKELKENPELLFEAENYYPVNEEGKKDYENGNYPEVYEFWAISKWLSEKLEEKGEIIFEMLDFIVWGRQTTGQAILMDNVIEEIVKDSF